MLLGFFIIDGIPISVISLIIYFIIYFIRRHKEAKKSFLTHFVRFLLIACITSLIYLTIFWSGINLNASFRFLNLQPFVWLTKTYEMGYHAMLKQLITNIAMFVPYGLLIPLVFKRMRKWWRTDLVVFATSFLIELIQYFIGRSCDVDDLIMNTVGGCVGYLLFAPINIIFKNSKWYKKMIGIM